MSVAYGAGLRVSEVVALKVSDIDGQRMTLRVEQGKGRKDRYAMLNPVLLERLRAWWRPGHAQGKILPVGWLFPGMDLTDHVTARQLNRAVRLAAATAGLDPQTAPAKRRAPGCAASSTMRGRSSAAALSRSGGPSVAPRARSVLGEFSAGASRTVTSVARASHALASEASLDLTYRGGS
jgi:integrase